MTDQAAQTLGHGEILTKMLQRISKLGLAFTIVFFELAQSHDKKSEILSVHLSSVSKCCKCEAALQ